MLCEVEVMSLTRILRATLILSISTAFGQNPSGLDVLHRLAQADGVAYRALRDEVLATNRPAWDVSGAAANSWEQGVAASALNARERSPQDFARWDAQSPQLKASGHWFAPGALSGNDYVAFLLEKIWKPLHPKDTERALNDLALRMSEADARSGDTALWIAIWEDCPIELLREIAIYYLAARSDLDALAIAASVLRDHDHPKAVRRQHRCLYGLQSSELPSATTLVIQEWEHFKSNSALSGKALAILGASSNVRARQVVYAEALDPTNEEMLRHDALLSCSLRRHTGDREFLQEFLTSVTSLRLKRQVVSDLASNFPYEWIRPIMLDILRSSTDGLLVPK